MSKRERKSGRRTEERAAALKMLSRLRSGADLRRRKVRRVRSAIRSRAYENELKLSIAMERLLGE